MNRRYGIGLSLLMVAATAAHARAQQQKTCPAGTVQVGVTHSTKPDGTPVIHLLCQQQEAPDPQPASTDGCGQVPALQDRFTALNQSIAVDRQIERSFGFDKTVEQIEYYGQLPDRQVEEFQAKFKQLVLNEALNNTFHALKEIQSLTPDEVEAINQMAQAEGLPPVDVSRGSQEVSDAIDVVQTGRKVYGVMDAARKKQFLSASVKIAGMVSKNPNFGLVLGLDEWAGYELYESIDAVQKVHDLTLATQSDLLNLKVVSGRLKKEVDELTAVKKKLAELGPRCSSPSPVP